MKRKAVLVTGSSKGLGKSLALVFAKNNYNIILHGRDKRRLRAVEEAVLRCNVDCETVTGDITSNMAFNTIDKLYKSAKRRDIDILINNAGIYMNESFQGIDFFEVERIMDVNLISLIQLTGKIYPIFLKKKSGLVVNINSIAGKNPNEMEAIYCASKYGLRGFMDSFQIEANKNNIRIINIYLGAMQTTMTEGRADQDKLIQTEEAVDAIFRACKDYKSLRVTEVNIQRRIY